MTDNRTGFVDRYGDVAVVTAIALAVLVIYGQTIRFDFINLDDNLYVFDNPTIKSGMSWETVKWAFTVSHSANWHPLTWLTHMLDVEMFALNAGGHHAVNVIYHIINSVLAFAVFRRMTQSFWQSALVGVLFAVHPAHVESVAWISERKDVLSTMFWLLTMFAYIRWNETGSRLSSPLYGATIVLFALGLMSKPMLVTLPFVLLLCDYWPLERLKLFDWKCTGLLFAEKIPLFVLSAASSYVTVLAQRAGGSIETLEYLPLEVRFVNALVAYAKYIATLFYPANLAVWYPYDRNFPSVQIVGTSLLLLAITGICLWQIRTRKYLLMGWLWFLGTLVPVIGIVQVGSQSMADRYTYVPYFGLFIMLVWGICDLFKKFGLDQKIAIAFLGVASVMFAVVSFGQASVWRDHETLYRHTLAVTKDNFLIAHNLCHALTLQDRLDEAESYCRASLSVRPDYYEAFNTLGVLELKRGQLIKSEENFQQVLRLAPNYATGYANIAVAQALLGKPEEAEANLEKAVILSGESTDPSVWVNTLRDVAAAYATTNNYEKAAANLRRILFIDPGNVSARTGLTFALIELNRFDEALQVIEPVAQSNINDATVYNVYGQVLLGKNRNNEAAEQFEKALEIKPDFDQAKENLKKAGGRK